MADSHVDLVFGAKVGDLLSGVSQVRHAIEELRSPIDGFIRNLRGIGEAIGLAFAVEKLTEFADKMSDIGEHAVNMGIALGTSAEQFQQLSEAMSLVGANSDALVRQQRMLERASQTAVTNTLSPQADAFRALRIDAKAYGDFLQTDMVGAMKQLADAAVRFGNTSVTGPLGGLFGRSANADIFAFYARGAQGIDEFIHKVKETNPASDETLHRLADLAEKIHLMSVAFEHLGLAIVDGVNKPLGIAIDLITKFTAGATGVLQGKGSGQPGMASSAQTRGIMADFLVQRGYPENQIAAILGNASQESGFDPGAKNASGHFGLFQWDQNRQKTLGGSTDVIKQMELMDAELSKLDPAFKTASGSVEELTKRFEKSFERSGGQNMGGRISAAEMSLPEVHVEADAEKRRVINTAAIQKNLAEEKKAINEKFKAQDAELQLEIQAARNHDDIIGTIEKQRTALAKEHLAEIAAAEAKASQASEGVVKGEGPAKAQTDLLGIQKQALAQDQQAAEKRANIAISAAQTQIKVLDQQEQAELKLNQHRAELDQLTYDQAAANEIKIVEAHRKAVDAILADEKRLAGDRHTVVQEVSNRQVELQQKAADQIAQINQKLETESYKTWKSIGDNIASAMSSSIVGVIKGTETIGQAFAKLGDTILEHLLNKGLTKGIDALDGSLFESLFGGATAGLGGGILTGFAGGAGLFGGLGGAAAGGGLFGGIGKLFAPLLGLFGLEGGGVVPSARFGWQVPSFANGGVLSMLHSNEMVLPKHLSEGVQNAINGGGFGGGGLTMNFHGPADGASIKRWVGDTLRQNPNYVSDLFRRNAITPRNS